MSPVGHRGAPADVPAGTPPMPRSRRNRSPRSGGALDPRHRDEQLLLVGAPRPWSGAACLTPPERDLDGAGGAKPPTVSCCWTITQSCLAPQPSRLPAWGPATRRRATGRLHDGGSGGGVHELAVLLQHAAGEAQVETAWSTAVLLSTNPADDAVVGRLVVERELVAGVSGESRTSMALKQAGRGEHLRGRETSGPRGRGPSRNAISA